MIFGRRFAVNRLSVGSGARCLPHRTLSSAFANRRGSLPAGFADRHPAYDKAISLATNPRHNRRAVDRVAASAARDDMGYRPPWDALTISLPSFIAFRYHHLSSKSPTLCSRLSQAAVVRLINSGRLFLFTVDRNNHRDFFYGGGRQTCLLSCWSDEGR